MDGGGEEIWQEWGKGSREGDMNDVQGLEAG
jgi:hypothetical protein